MGSILLTYYQEPQGDQGCVGLGPNWLILKTTFAIQNRGISVNSYQPEILESLPYFKKKKKKKKKKEAR